MEIYIRELFFYTIICRRKLTGGSFYSVMTTDLWGRAINIFHRYLTAHPLLPRSIWGVGMNRSRERADVKTCFQPCVISIVWTPISADLCFLSCSLLRYPWRNVLNLRNESTLYFLIRYDRLCGFCIMIYLSGCSRIVPIHDDKLGHYIKKRDKVTWPI